MSRGAVAVLNLTGIKKLKMGKATDGKLFSTVFKTVSPAKLDFRDLLCAIIPCHGYASETIMYMLSKSTTFVLTSSKFQMCDPPPVSTLHYYFTNDI